MASCFMLMKQHEDVLVYLNSIKVSSARERSRERLGKSALRRDAHRFPTQLFSLQQPPSLFSQSYFYNDDTFNYNYGQALAATANWKDAEEALLLIQSEQLKNDYTYLSWLSRCCTSLTKYLKLGDCHYSPSVSCLSQTLNSHPSISATCFSQQPSNSHPSI